MNNYSRRKFLMLPYLVTNFEMQKYCENECKFSGVNWRNKLSKIKDGAYVINLDEYKSIGTRWRALYVNGNNVSYFDSFGIEHSPKEIRKFIGNKNIITNVYRKQTFDSIMCGYFFVGFIDFILKYKSLLQYTNLFSLNDYEKNDKVLPKYFQQLKIWKIYMALFVVSIDNLKILKHHTSKKNY